MTGSTHPTVPASLQDRQHPILFTDRDIAEAKRLLTIIAGSKPDVPPAQQDRELTQRDGDHLRRLAAQIFAQRQGRIAYFGPEMFSEPGWEMLLILYLEEGRQRLLQTRLIELSGASRSTAARWIDHLIGRKLVRREGHPTDKRRNFVSLTDNGRNLLELYLSETFG